MQRPWQSVSYRHFKEKQYLIIPVAAYSETGKPYEGGITRAGYRTNYFLFTTKREFHIWITIPIKTKKR